MKSKLMLSVLLALSAQNVMAGPDHTDMPFLYPDKCITKKSIVIPEGVDGTSYYFNRDCSVAYIVPPPVGEVQVSKPAVFQNLRLCPAQQSTLNTIVKIQAQIEAISDLVGQMTPDDPRFSVYIEKQNSLRKLASDMQKDFSNIPALRVQMNFKSSLTPEYMKSVMAANLPSIEEGRIKIRPAPLQKSYISFSSVIPGTTKTFDGNPVLESNVMGILSKADENSQTRDSVRFQGSAAGYVVLSLDAACPLMTGDYKDPANLTFNAESTTNYITATNTMMVPAMSAFGYSAKLDVDNFTDLFFNKFGRKTQFSASEISDLVLGGEANRAITINSWTYEDLSGEQQTQYRDMVSAENQKVIRDSLMQEYMNQLVQFNILREVKTLETPNAGNDTRTGTRRECWSNSSWFGLSRNSGCRDVVFQFQVPVDGTSEQSAKIKNNLKANFKESAEFLHPTTRVYTSTFEFKGK